MKNINGTLYYSASDLVGHLNCEHLSNLDKQVVTGLIQKPDHYDPLLEILRERGYRHEEGFIQHLKDQGYSVVVIDGVGISDQAIEDTSNAMKRGVDVIAQGAFRFGAWQGRSDILRRVEKSSNFGSWSYEIIDTKLARETKGGSVLQLCLYADLLSELQGVPPELVYIVSPWSEYQPQAFRFSDFSAYFRSVKRSAETFIGQDNVGLSYPDPKSHCDICRWQKTCDKKRRDDDHLCLVANIYKSHINELKENNVDTVHKLAELSGSFSQKRGSVQTYTKLKEQAALQLRSIDSGKILFELLDVVPPNGLAALPGPSKGDIFFDIESDQFVGEHGIEYLFGFAFFDENGQAQYQAHWALDRESEKSCFEIFVDFVLQRKQEFPDMHIYHYAPYEPSALKRLMGRYATRELEIDSLLRGQRFIDLLSVVKHAIRAGVESYSLKKIEPLYGFDRKASLQEANSALTRVSVALELDDISSLDDHTKHVVQLYNADDCNSTLALRNWLEALRSQQVDNGIEVPRPQLAPEDASVELDEQARLVQELILKLTRNVPADVEERSEEEQARWLLAYLLEWHRREEKSVWWEYFRLSGLTSDELIQEKAAISELSLQAVVDSTKTGIPTHRYRFSQQDTDIRVGDEVRQAGGDKLGVVTLVDAQARTVDVKKSKATADVHPEAIFSHKIVPAKEQAASLFRLGSYVAENGLNIEGPYCSACSLLLRSTPDLGGQSMRQLDEDTLTAALRISRILDKGVLPIQGPPGTGKSHTGARMICSFVQQGKKVGITANSHKVIRNLLDKVIEAADEMGIALRCVQKPASDSKDEDTDSLYFVKGNGDIYSALNSGNAQVAGATHFLWSREDALESLDVLVVDEAAQMSLANVLAVGQAAKTLVLLGDPQQLEQPSQGSHPEGTDVSALDHILAGHQTITDDKGLFLGVTWRLHPEICRFNSELFYEDKLSSKAGCEQQTISSNSLFNGQGLRYIPATHTGNTSSSIEEVVVVENIVGQILNSGATWTDRDGQIRPLEMKDILIIAPYNAQVFEVQQRLPDANVGTVDKFQGQEAPITIYTMATSSHADAPRGMEFLYSLNRLNVAVSRAKCLCILVASPSVFDAECKTPRQMQLANAYCRYLELATTVRISD
jgi:predicted RecB family nuclease